MSQQTKAAPVVPQGSPREITPVIIKVSFESSTNDSRDDGGAVISIDAGTGFIVESGSNNSWTQSRSDVTGRLDEFSITLDDDTFFYPINQGLDQPTSIVIKFGDATLTLDETMDDSGNFFMTLVSPDVGFEFDPPGKEWYVSGATFPLPPDKISISTGGIEQGRCKLVSSSLTFNISFSQDF